MVHLPLVPIGQVAVVDQALDVLGRHDEDAHDLLELHSQQCTQVREKVGWVPIKLNLWKLY